jgi:hypothetical protein
VRELVHEVEQGVADALRGRTLADLLAEKDPVDPPVRPS